MTGHGICEKTGKTIFRSSHEGRAALMGQLKSKRIRVYRCGAHFHVTKEANTSLKKHNKRKS